MPAKGGIPWNKGLTKDNNVIVAGMAKHKTGSIVSEESNIKRSKTLKEFWKSDLGKIAKQKVIEKNKTQDYSLVSQTQKALYKTKEGQEIIRKRTQKLVGSKRSEETKQKMRLAQKGKIISLETRLKISKTMQKRMDEGKYALPFSKSELCWGE